MPQIGPDAVDAWLDAFAASVRSEDYQAGRALFAPDCSGFGTVTSGYRGLDDLVASQWSRVWGRTRDFAFDPDSHRMYGAEQCTVAVTWRSLGTDLPEPRVRQGRATLVLRAGDDGALRCVHSHFSMLPGTSA